jgi:hypothetical protein
VKPDLDEPLEELRLQAPGMTILINDTLHIKDIFSEGITMKVGQFTVIVYDNGGETLDRYTVMPCGSEWMINTAGRRTHRMYLGVDDFGGRSFSQWGELPVERSYKHLGKRLSRITPELRKHIARRLAE